MLIDSGLCFDIGRWNSPEWRAGFVAMMVGLGDDCPHPQASVAAIDWQDGQAEALRALRLVLLED